MVHHGIKGAFSPALTLIVFSEYQTTIDWLKKQLLEELSVEWKTLEGDDLKTYQDGKYALTRNPSDWHPYNPNAERDARLQMEGTGDDILVSNPKFNLDSGDYDTPVGMNVDL